MPRVSNWPAQLTEAVRLAGSRSFVWGESDCCLISADIIRAITGIDPAKDIRGTYDSRLGAARVVEGFGGIEAMAGAFAAQYGWPEVPTNRASRGDLVMSEPETEGGWPALGICVGPDAVFPGESGLVFKRVRNCAKAWRIS